MTNALITAYTFMHPDALEMAAQEQSNVEICLHHSQTYHLGFPNGPFQLAKRPVSRPKTGCFATPNGMYW